MNTRSWLRLGVAVTIGSLAAIAIFALVHHKRVKREHALRQWREAELCMFDEVGSAEITKAFRTRQLMGVKSDGGPWPFACAVWVDRTRDALGEGNASFDALSHALKAPSAATSEVTALASTVALARAAVGLEPRPKHDSTSYLTIETLEREMSISNDRNVIDRISTERFASEHLPLLIDDQRGPLRVCTMSPSDQVMHCNEFSRPDDQAFALDGTSDEGQAPHVFAQPKPVPTHWGVHYYHHVYSAADGHLINMSPLNEVLTGHVAKDGSITLFGRDAKSDRVVVTRSIDGSSTVATLVDPPVVYDDFCTRPYREPMGKGPYDLVFGDVVGWADGKGKETAFGFVSIAGLKDPGATIKRPDAHNHCPMSLDIEGCRAGNKTFIRNERTLVGIGKAFVALDPSVQFGATCTENDRGPIPFRQDDSSGHCGTASCGLFQLTNDTLDRGNQDAKATVRFSGWIGDKFLVVWSTAHLGIRYRLAEPSQFEGTADRILIDHAHAESPDAGDSLNGDAVRMRLFSRPTFALVLIASARGVFAIRIDGEGNATVPRVVVSGSR